MIPEIHFKTIPHNEQRYNTEGDYFKNGKVIEFRVSEFNNRLVEMIIFIHELWEYYRTNEKGIDIKEIDKFDKESGLEDPGLSPDAPYHKEHMESVRIEKLLCHLAGIKYGQYYKAKHL